MASVAARRMQGKPAVSGLATRRGALLALGVAALPAAGWTQGDGDAFSGLAGTQLRFAALDLGRSLLTADDEWMAATSEFQRRAVMGRTDAVTRAAFRRWNGEAVRPWSAAQRARWRAALAGLAPAFNALRMPLPDEVWLVASNGQESAGAPYTRGNAVVLPGAATVPGYSDAALMAHELWHVVSRHAPALATRLYAEIGFEPIPPLVFPPAWAAIRIANPDAPDNRHAMRLELNGRMAWVAPVLVASRTALQPGETFFDVADLRLLEVEPDPTGKLSHAVLRDGQPLWHALDGHHDYLRRLGGNSGYVIHPEETMADNVALLVTAAPPRNPALLARLKAVFEAKR